MKLMTIHFLLIIALFSLSNCKKDDDDNNTNATCTDGIKNQNENGVDCGGACAACSASAITINSTEQVYFKLDGVPYSFITDGSSGYQVFWGASRSNGVDSSFAENYTSTIFNEASFKGTGIGIGSLWYTFDVLPSSAEFESLFKVGDYDYTENALYGATVDVFVGDPNEEFFSSSKGTMLQDSNSKFRITDVQSYSQLGDIYVKVRIEFSCKVYSSIDGSMKTVTDGVYVASFANI